MILQMPKRIKYHFLLFKPSGELDGKRMLVTLLPYREEQDKNVNSLNLCLRLQTLKDSFFFSHIRNKIKILFVEEVFLVVFFLII